ncbi:MAG: DRTGG domain-containing protein [Candidatus Methanofastidiosia archaeon]
MKSLLITSTGVNAGKTTLALGIGLNFKGKVGYLKPLGDRIRNKLDEDAILFKEVFGLSEDALKLTVENNYFGILKDLKDVDIGEKLKVRYDEISKGKDFMILESPQNISYGAYAKVSAPEISIKLRLKALIVAEGDSKYIQDKLSIAKGYFDVMGAELAGCIINKSKKSLRDEIEDCIKVFGEIPEEKLLKIIRVKEIAEHLDAKILAGEGGVGNLVEHILVGAMTFDSAIKMLEKLRYENNAIITGGDRTDLQLAGFESNASCLILTENIFPNPSVLRKADERKIPVLLVPYDTVSAIKETERVISKIRAEDKQKLKKIKELTLRHVNLETLLEDLT